MRVINWVAGGNLWWDYIRSRVDTLMGHLQIHVRMSRRRNGCKYAN